MSKHIIKGYITFTQYAPGCTPTIDYQTFKPSAKYSPCTVVVAEHQIEVEVPDDFYPRPAMVASLEEEKKLLTEEFSKSVKEINDQINSLLAIEM